MDTILYGKIYTMDRENPYVEAVGIKDGKIAYAGGGEEDSSRRIVPSDRLRRRSRLPRIQ